MKTSKYIRKTMRLGLLMVLSLFTHQAVSLDTALVQAKFTYTPSVETAYGIEFNLSATNFMDVSHYTWDFGDGNFFTDNYYMQSYSHTYDEAGIYNACLTVVDDYGIRNSYCENVFVKELGTVSNEQIHEGSFHIQYDTNGLFEFNFTPSFANADGLSYYWDFGDGTSSDAYAPTHTFKDSRKYWVKLMVRDGDRVYATSELVDVDLAECHTNFDFAFIDSSTIKLTNRSAANIGFHYWMLGDGRTEINLTLDTLRHTFAKPGVYDIVLFTMDTTDTYECVNFKLRQVRVGNVGCNADFSYFVDTLSGNNMGYFKANALGQNPEYNWTFGDGSRYHTPVVTHQFTQPGYNKVRLSVKTDRCINTKEETVLILSQGDDCEADFNYFIFNPQSDDRAAVRLTDNSFGENLSYTWRVGDSTLPSTGNAAEFSTINSAYVYNFCLTVDNGKISNTTCKDIYLPRPGVDPCKAQFTYFVDTLTNAVSFENQSIGTGSFMGIKYISWDFGDGNSSTEENPTHTYASAGYYPISLEIECQDPADLNKKERYAYRLIDVNTGNNTLKGDFVINRNPNPARFKISGYPVDFVGISHGDAAKIRWDFENDGIIDDSTSTSPTWYYPESDSIYTCCYYIEDPITGIEDQICRQLNAKSGQFLDEETSITLVSALVSSFTVYPNPVTNGLAVAQFSVSNTTEILITLFNSEGRPVSTLEKGRFTSGEYNTLLNATTLTPGIYYLQLVANGNSHVVKVIVQ